MAFCFDFENGLTKQGIHYSRYIASWLNAMGYTHDIHKEMFKDWLKTLSLTDDEVKDITDMLTNGKLELECHAKKFVTEHV